MDQVVEHILESLVDVLEVLDSSNRFSGLVVNRGLSTDNMSLTSLFPYCS